MPFIASWFVARRDDVGRCLVKCVLVACVSVPALSNGQAPSAESLGHAGNVGFGAPSELENRPRSSFESSLMRELACTCGTCQLERIDSCRCAFAARMRGEVLAQLDGLDVSTEGARL